MYIKYKLCLIFLFSLIIINNFSYAKPEDEENEEVNTKTTLARKIKTTEQDEIEEATQVTTEDTTEDTSEDTTESTTEEKKVTQKVKVNVKKPSKKKKKKGLSIKMHQSQQQEVIFDEPDDSDISSKNEDSLLEMNALTYPPSYTEKMTSYPIKVVTMPPFDSFMKPLPALPPFEPLSMTIPFLPFFKNKTFPKFKPFRPMESIRQMMFSFPALYTTLSLSDTQTTTTEEDIEENT